MRLHPGDPFDPPCRGEAPSPPPPPPQESSPGGSSAGGGRLNLLLTCASWRSDSWADRLPTLLEPMGIYSLRARTAREAERTIRCIPVHIAVVDLGLPLDEPRPEAPAPPAEAGPRVLELLRRLEDPPPTVVIKGPRPIRDEARSLAAALRFDAFAVVDRAAADVELMLKIFQRALARFYQDRWPDTGRPPSPPREGSPPRPAF